MKRVLMLILFAVFISLVAFKAEANEPNPVFKEASVHDPSVIKVEDTFYVFGSHLAAAKSKDFMQWEQITTHVHEGNKLIPNVYEELSEALEWANSDTLWAADVIQLDDGRYYMYYNACEGSSPRSAMGIAVADHIEGPYENLGIFLKSGMWGEESENSGEIYDPQKHPNVIDPHVFFDAENRLWMVYGSYSGGLFILEMNSETGFPLEEQGYGTKLIGGNHARIEAPYIQYHPDTEHYYLYMTFGGLDTTGGYNMRVARAENPEGPYYDAEGNNMLDVYSDPTLPLFDDQSIEPYGVKLMGNFLFKRELGEAGSGIGNGYISPGHNSVYYDEEKNEQYLIFHTRFPQRGEEHEIRVHQMFMNEEGWPVVAPVRYSNLALTEVVNEEIAGDFRFINHGKQISAEINESVYISLNHDGTITGSETGSWQKYNDDDILIELAGVEYVGVVQKQWDPHARAEVITFSALSEQGVAIWGSQLKSLKNEELVQAIADQLNLGATHSVIQDIFLPTLGSRGAIIEWESSHPEYISPTGKVTRPISGEGNITTTLTATIKKEQAIATVSFEMTVLENVKSGLVVHYPLDGHLEDSSGTFRPGTIVGNQIDSDGGNLLYEEGIVGEAVFFDGETGVRLDDGLITSDQYSVSFWLKPSQLTTFSTTFFAAKDSENWLSFVPMGHDGVQNQTMLWSGSQQWYDASLGTSLDINEWSHITFTNDRGEIQLFLNGELVFEGSDFPHIFSSGDATFTLGVNWWDEPYKGLMDEILIYNEIVLSQSEIISYYQSNGLEIPRKENEDSDTNDDEELIIDKDEQESDHKKEGNDTETDKQITGDKDRQEEMKGNQKREQEQIEQRLPNTSTDSHRNVLIGIVISLIGAGLFTILKVRIIKMKT
ncbi:beta-xylosidase [Bacillus sp. TS-2]|nr:beta-xylosidase [Bacillus sp. TS-2]